MSDSLSPKESHITPEEANPALQPGGISSGGTNGIHPLTSASQRSHESQEDSSGMQAAQNQQIANLWYWQNDAQPQYSALSQAMLPQHAAYSLPQWPYSTLLQNAANAAALSNLINAYAQHAASQTQGAIVNNYNPQQLASETSLTKLPEAHAQDNGTKLAMSIQKALVPPVALQAAPKGKRSISANLSNAANSLPRIAMKKIKVPKPDSPSSASDVQNSRDFNASRADASKVYNNSDTGCSGQASESGSTTDYKATSSIPPDLSPREYARQCKHAAISSRLSPDSLHPNEYQLLRKHISHQNVTTYLNIRNGILRLWQRNPLVSVTREEAVGCAKESRFSGLAVVAYDWLIRNGYINFGCIEVPKAPAGTPRQEKKKRGKTILVIGAGMAGLGCARQLEGLTSQLSEFIDSDEESPKVILLEARNRIGGRVYSHPLHDQSRTSLAPGKKATADLGASIITGFDNGNPLSILVRGQLALEYHELKDDSVLYDVDGLPVNKERDVLVERLYNDMLDRVSVFKVRSAVPRTVHGDSDLIDAGKNPVNEGKKTIAEEEGDDLPQMHSPPRERAHLAPFSANQDKLTGKPGSATGSSAKIPAGEQIEHLGWRLKENAPSDGTIDLKPQHTSENFPSLGKTMDYVLAQYQNLLDLTPLDLRLINWHYANLEYANAVNVDKLSLAYWDQDDGNEFKGAHCMMVGGYNQVARGLYLAPRKLDVRFNSAVSKIDYESSGIKVECTNGKVFEADHVVVTLPLGVLKTDDVQFNPPLPEWKRGAIERLGYGVLNKVVLVYKEPFWDVNRDMVGALREPLGKGGDFEQSSYVSNRVALMAGDAAEQAEGESDEALVAEATVVLSRMYPQKTVPKPEETIITRWRADPYARGSYSYVGLEATADDYNHIAASIDNKIFFAGEASCGTHPATVHGAYISGLRAASEVADAIFGPIQVPTPLVYPKSKSGSKRKAENNVAEKLRELKQKRLAEYEDRLKVALHKALGDRPHKPDRTGLANPFLLYQKDKWGICKERCDKEKQRAMGDPGAKASRNELRAALGRMWKEAPEEERRPYLAESEKNKRINEQASEKYKEQLIRWEDMAENFRQEWRKKNPSKPSKEELELLQQAEDEAAETKRMRRTDGFYDEESE